MALFFFNLVSPGTYDRDEIGCEFDSVEIAFIEAHKAAVAIIADMLQARVNPGKYQFEITDENGRFLIELPFSEVLTPGVAPILHSALQDNIRRQLTEPASFARTSGTNWTMCAWLWRIVRRRCCAPGRAVTLEQ